MVHLKQQECDRLQEVILWPYIRIGEKEKKLKESQELLNYRADVCG